MGNSSEVFLRPRAWANLLKDEQGNYRYCVMSTGAMGIRFPNREAYGCESRSPANAAEMDEVRREAEAAAIEAMCVLGREYERVARRG